MSRSILTVLIILFLAASGFAQVSSLPFNGGPDDGYAEAVASSSPEDSCYFLGNGLEDTLAGCYGESVTMDGTELFAEDYLWSTGDTSAIISADSTGWYFLETSIGSCVKMDSVYFISSVTPELSVTITDASAPGSPDGSILVEIISALFPVDVYWDPGPNEYLLDSVASGEYIFYVVDAVGCEYEVSFYVGYDTCYSHVANLPDDTLLVCSGDSILLENEYDAVSGYVWSTGDTASAIWLSDTGWYYLDLSWPGCSNSIDSVYADYYPVFGGSIASGAATDGLFPDGTLTFIPDSTGIFSTYLWSNGDTDSVAENLEPGVYDLMVADISGCEYEFSAVVDTGLCYDFYFSMGPDVFGCEGDSVALFPVGSASGTYLWNDSLSAESASLSIPDTAILIISDSTCFYSDTVLLGLTVMPDIQIDVTPASRPINFDGAIEVLYPDGDINEYSIIWSTGDTVFSIGGLDTGWYNFTLTDTAGCEFYNDIFLPFDSCYTPYGITVSDTTNTSFTVSWTGPEIATYLAFYKNITEGTGFYNIMVPDGETSVVIPAGLGQEIRYKIKFACGETNSESPLITFIMPEDSVLRTSTIDQFSVWPNPFLNELYFTSKSEATWMMTDLYGQVIQLGLTTSEDRYTVIETWMLPTGIYFLSIQSSDLSASFTLFRQ